MGVTVGTGTGGGGGGSGAACTGNVTFGAVIGIDPRSMPP